MSKAEHPRDLEREWSNWIRAEPPEGMCNGEVSRPPVHPLHPPSMSAIPLKLHVWNKNPSSVLKEQGNSCWWVYWSQLLVLVRAAPGVIPLPVKLPSRAARVKTRTPESSRRVNGCYTDGTTEAALSADLHTSPQQPVNTAAPANQGAATSHHRFIKMGPLNWRWGGVIHTHVRTQPGSQSHREPAGLPEVLSGVSGSVSGSVWILLRHQLQVRFYWTRSGGTEPELIQFSATPNSLLSTLRRVYLERQSTRSRSISPSIQPLGPSFIEGGSKRSPSSIFYLFQFKLLYRTPRLRRHPDPPRREVHHQMVQVKTTRLLLSHVSSRTPGPAESSRTRGPAGSSRVQQSPAELGVQQSPAGLGVQRGLAGSSRVQQDSGSSRV
ncbi:uncharacterized protein FYW61_011363 [Anableps anableps]